jgi:hypothetical protein
MSIIRPFAITLAVLTLFVSDVFARGNSDKNHSDTPPQSEPAWATSIQFAPELRAEVDDLLRRSPTFRVQYQRIAETASVVVGVTVDVRLCQTSYRARTTFRRYQSGLIVAAVAIGPGSHRGEWIAHEFEHLLEQLDGRNLPQLANNRAKDVWYSGSDVIETGRAIRAGRTVRDELRHSPSTR